MKCALPEQDNAAMACGQNLEVSSARSSVVSGCLGNVSEMYPMVEVVRRGEKARRQSIKVINAKAESYLSTQLGFCIEQSWLTYYCYENLEY